MCERLEGGAYDECVWTVAREEGNAATCADMLDSAKAATCADAIYLKRALEEEDAAACESISDAEKKTACLAAIAGPTTRENCLTRNGAAYCAEFDLYLQAEAAQDPDKCAMITDADLSELCVELVSPGDRDFDGLDAGEEAAYGSSDTSADTDGDGFADSEEIKNGNNPNGSGML